MSNMFPSLKPDISSQVDIKVPSDVRTLESDAAKIEESSESIASKTYAAQRLAPFFQIEISLKIFGKEIWHWVFPPTK